MKPRITVLPLNSIEASQMRPCIRIVRYITLIILVVASMAKSGSNILAAPIFVQPPQKGRDGYLLSLTNSLGARFALEASTDLIRWIPLATLTNLQGVVRFTDTNSATFDRRFYRALDAPTIQISFDAASPLLLRSKHSDGTVIDFLGKKDASGLPMAVESARFQMPSGEANDVILDQSGRISEMRAFNGVVFRFVWETNFTLRFTAITADGKTAVTLPIRWDTFTVGPGVVSSVNPSTLMSGPRLSGSAPNQIPKASSTAKGSFQSKISVKQCGVLPVVDAVVWVKVKAGSASFELPATRIEGPIIAASEPGVYVASFPKPELADKFESSCKWMTEKLNITCDAIGLIALPQHQKALCLVLAAALVETGLAAPVLRACEVALPPLLTYCGSVGLSAAVTPPNSGFKGLSDYLCEYMRSFLPRNGTTEYEVTPVVWTSKHGQITGPTQKFSSLGLNPTSNPGSFPSFTVDLPGETDKLVIKNQTPRVAIGQTLQLEAEALLRGGTPCADLKVNLEWSSSSEAADIDHATGLVTGKKFGSTRVTVKDALSGATTSVLLEVGGRITDIEIAPANPGVPSAASFILSATPKDKDGHAVEVPSAKLIWSVFPTGIAEITSDASGRFVTVKGLIKGQTQITITETESGLRRTVLLKVTGPIDRVEIVQKSPTVEKGRIFKLSARAFDNNGDEVSVLPGQWGWSEANFAVASVDQDGLVTGQSVGETVIAVKHLPTGKVAAVSVKVAPPVKLVVRPPEDSNGIYRFLLTPGGEPPLPGEAGPRYQLRLAGGTWLSNPPHGTVNVQNAAILLTKPLPNSETFFEFAVAPLGSAIEPEALVFDTTGNQLIAKSPIPSVLILDDYAKTGTFSVSLDAKNYGVFTQRSSTGLIFDVSDWKAGETHRLILFLSSYHGTLAGTVLCLWMPPWFKFTKGKFHFNDRIEDKRLDSSSPCIYFQSRGAQSAIMTHLELELERSVR
jgi:hypothetical protein